MGRCVLGVFAAAAALAALEAHAAAPTLSLVSTGGDSAQVSVTGDPNAGVMLFYNVGSASGAFSTTLGSTNTSGSFSAAVSASSYAISPGSSVYVVVNGQQSPVQTWPSAGTAAATVSGGSPTFSQSSVTVGAGQTITVVSQGNATGLYLLSNSSPTTATVSASGTQVTITGQQIGVTTARFCYIGTATSCSDISVTVGAASVATSTLMLDKTALVLAAGQAGVVNLSGGSGYYMSGTTNAVVSSQSISGSTLTITGLANGTATVTVCSASGGCGAVTVTVGASAAATPTWVKFTSTNPPVMVGQTATVSLTGGSGKYTVGNNPSPNLVQAATDGSTLKLTGVGPGSAFVTVCDATNSNNCDTVFFTVAVAAATPFAPVQTAAPTPVFAPPAPAAVVAAPSPAAVQTTPGTQGTVSTSELLAGILSMQRELAQILTQIQAIQTRLNQLAASVAAGAPSGSVAATGKYQFFYSLSVGSTGNEVTALQNRLTAEGYYSGPVTGYYGSLTKAAVAVYQTAKGLPASGVLDTATRAALNAAGQ